MLQFCETQESVEVEEDSSHGSFKQSNLDEPTRMAYYLFNCSKKFMSSETIQVLPAMKCLYMALSMVLAPQIEVELRLALGNILLDHTKNFNEALDQIQKAHQLAESSLGAIKFEEKCRITRSLIDALIRTNSFQLAQNILETISIEALQIQSHSAWNWFIHFSLMNLQSKLSNEKLLHQVLSDIDGILKIIQNFIDSETNYSAWYSILLQSKVLIMSYLLIVLTSNNRKILSIYSIIPKAAEELRQSLNLLINNESDDDEITISTAFFAESLLLLNSVKFSNSNEIAMGISNLLKLFERQQNKFPNISQLKLVGHLIFINFEEFKLFGDFITILTLRQSPGAQFSHLQSEISRLTNLISSQSHYNAGFKDNLLMALFSFKTALDLEAGIINQISSKSISFGDQEFNKKFKECILSFTAHQVVSKLGIPKVVAFYDHKINSTSEVDINNLLFLNKALLTSSTAESLESSTLALQVLTNSLAFYLIKAVELMKSSAAAHHIRNALKSACDLLKSQMYHEPKLECIYNLLQGEFSMETDLEASRNHLHLAFQQAKEQLGNRNFVSMAAKKLVKSYKMTGDDQIAEQWSKFNSNSSSSGHYHPNGQPSSNTQNSSGSNSLPPLILSARFHELVITATGQNERLDPALEQGLNKIAEEFLDEIISSAAELTAHRGGSVLDVKDLLLPLERNYDLGMAGFVDSESRSKVTEARYRQMMFGTDAHQVRKNQVNSSQNQNKF